MNTELVLFTLVWVLLLLLGVLTLVYVWKNRDKNDAEEQMDKRDEEWSEVVKAMTEALNMSNQRIDELELDLHMAAGEIENLTDENIEFREGKELDMAKHYKAVIFLDKKGEHVVYNNGELVIDEQVSFFQYIKGHDAQFFVTHIDGVNAQFEMNQQEY